MEHNQSEVDEARAIYDDIYSIYERTSTNEYPGDYLHFATTVIRKYKLHQIMLVCKHHSITHTCINRPYSICYCKNAYGNALATLPDSIIHIKIRDIYVAFTPSTEYILK
jgi:hypothetical protein